MFQFKYYLYYLNEILNRNIYVTVIAIALQTVNSVTCAIATIVQIILVTRKSDSARLNPAWNAILTLSGLKSEKAARLAKI